MFSFIFSSSNPIHSNDYYAKQTRQINAAVCRKLKAMYEKEEEKLKFDEKYIEKIAREKFKMVKPGERVFKIVDEDSN